jgi:hypothetical protein
MKSLGIYMSFFGFASMVLQLIGREFVILSWINNWGIGTGWIIRIALVIVGGMLVIYKSREEESEY